MGIYGKEKAGKSFWFDKTLNLSKVNGNWYGKEEDEMPCLKFFGTPYRKGNLRMFLLDCTGFKNN